MRFEQLRFLGLGLTVGLSWGLPAAAQTVTPTSGSGDVGSIVSGTTDFTITGGSQQLNTLFHSFEDFSPETANVLFQLNGGQSSVEYVIGRVTGGNLSLIDAELKLTGGNSPDLFLINPNGITFEDNASLALPGSFIASTAESALFNNNLTFSALNPDSAPLLTISAPTGLQMGATSGSIQVNNVGHDLSSSAFSPVVLRGATPTGLSIGAGQTLALLGSNINTTGGLIGAPEGQAVLGAVSSADNVTLTPSSTPSSLGWQIGFDNVSEFGDITLAQQSLIDAGNTGAVTLQGKNIYFQDVSAVLQANFTGQAANPLQVNATDLIELTGREGNGILSGIFSLTAGAGRGGDITLSADQIRARENGGDIRNYTSGSGNGGDIVLNARDVSLIGGVEQDALIQSRTFGTGNNGNTTINADTLTVASSSIINNVNGGSGSAGNIAFNANESITIGPNTTQSTLIGSSAVSGSGNAGSITMTAPRVTIQGGVLISSSTFGAGNAGKIEINATEHVTIAGEGPTPASFTGEDRGVTTVRTSGVLLPIFVRTFLNLPNTITGDGGDIVFNTPQLTVTEQAQVNVQHLDQGNAGTIRVNAGQLIVSDDGQLLSSSVFGEGGNIELELSELLFLRRNGLIDSESLGTSNGGNITIKAPVIIGLEDSDIVADAITGNGGNIDITTKSLLGLEFREQRTSESDITANSEFGVSGTVAINNLTVESALSVVELPNAPAEADDQVATACTAGSGNQFMASGRGGLPVSPMVSLDRNRLWRDIRETPSLATPSLNAAESETALISASPTLEVAPMPRLVEADGWQVNEDGNVALSAVANAANNTIHPTNCLAQAKA